MTTKDKLQSQCCVFHAIADKAKYLSSILSRRAISAAAIEPVADRIEENAPQTGVFIHVYKNQRGCLKQDSCSNVCSDQN